MQKILISAFACNPFKGSEDGNGWNWSVGLASEGFEVHTLTRATNQQDIEKHEDISNLHFHYISLPVGCENLYAFSQATMYLYYLLWQLKAWQVAKALNIEYNFFRVHHTTWGSIQLGSFLYKLDVPFLFGPAGGGQKAPEELKDYFFDYWKTEIRREKISSWLLRFNPACNRMLKQAYGVMVSNKDTKKMVKNVGAKNIHVTLDAALPKDFFPPDYINRSPDIDEMKLLWVGRFMPRKGLLLVLDVMKELNEYPGITLTIVGDGEMMQAAKEKYREWELKNSVIFAGYVPLNEVRNYYKTHDLFLFTSLRDSCPAQVIEAMAFNLPVVTLELHGQDEIVNDKTGIKISVNSPKVIVQKLAGAIIELAEDSEKYQKMSKAAFEFSREQVWERKINEIVKKFY